MNSEPMAATPDSEALLVTAARGLEELLRESFRSWRPELTEEDVLIQVSIACAVGKAAHPDFEARRLDITLCALALRPRWEWLSPIEYVELLYAASKASFLQGAKPAPARERIQ